MLRRTRRALARASVPTFACATILGTLLASPGAALARLPRAGSGGAGIGTGGGGSAPTPPAGTAIVPAADVIKLDGVVNASGDGISLTVAASGTLGRPLTISGAAPASDAGALIEIESAKAGHSNWKQVADTTIASDGDFSAQWTPSANGRVALRAVLGPAGTSAGTTSATGSAGLSGSGGGSAAAAAGQLSTSPLTIPIFRNATATIYGPGLWGHHTACGQRLRHTTLGVASRTLRCGTEVAVLYQGREITVPVIDRGPFTKGVSWDLTLATARALGISETATIGTLTSKVAPVFTASS